MAASLRTFIAIPIPIGPGVRRAQQRLALFGSEVRPLEMTEMHLTVKFLGETSWELTAEITRTLEQICSQIPAHEAEVMGLGAFPRPSRPTVIWAGLEPNEAVCTLASRLNDDLSKIGFPREERAFQPHITVARVKGSPPPGLAEYITDHDQRRFHQVQINEVVLFQSELQRTGPVYTRLATIPLTGE